PEVSVVDLSLDGALIEHADLLRAGTLASVTLWLPGREVTFQCRVIRSLIHREEVSPTGAREVIYHTGLKFLDVSEIARRVLEECLASGGRGGADPDPA
ncbi:MAG: PilZ domain-containing protein, partial [Candidatus Methylomirabilales bacterium]